MLLDDLLLKLDSATLQLEVYQLLQISQLPLQRFEAERGFVLLESPVEMA